MSRPFAQVMPKCVLITVVLTPVLEERIKRFISDESATPKE